MVGEEVEGYGAGEMVARREGGIRGVWRWVGLEGALDGWVCVCVGGTYI